MLQLYSDNEWYLVDKFLSIYQSAEFDFCTFEEMFKDTNVLCPTGIKNEVTEI